MSTPIDIPLNSKLLNDLIDQIDMISNSDFTDEEIFEDLIDIINTYSNIYNINYNGDNKIISNMLKELKDIKTIIDSNQTIQFKVETIRLLPIYRMS